MSHNAVALSKHICLQQRFKMFVADVKCPVGRAADCSKFAGRQHQGFRIWFMPLVKST